MLLFGKVAGKQEEETAELWNLQTSAEEGIGKQYQKLHTCQEKQLKIHLTKDQACLSDTRNK